MTHIGLLVTPDPTVPARPIEFQPSELLRLLRREVVTGDDAVDSTSVLSTPFGPIVMWVGDASMLNPELAHNDRAIGICRAVDYPVPTVRGNAFFVGGVDDEGWHVGLDPTLLAQLERNLATFPADAPMEYGPALQQEDVVEVTTVGDVDELLAVLYPEGRPSDG